MKARLASSQGIVETEVSYPPPPGLKHEGVSYRLMDYDGDPAWDGAAAHYYDPATVTEREAMDALAPT